ncbi:XRE family transcriptional regulator [Vitreimonas flagellata]|uniref:XRE family transcriptional regulator n=1 Tax=Vitreimonas flagellata TaxID=2560861 RepID=UPI00107508D4|nr:helix-turn-helix domain-containing protein [Vitreimonas flagellata]
MKLTPFGQALRALRIERGLRLLDMAKTLGCSSAFLSAVETGRKSVPPAFFANIVNEYGLAVPEVESLRRALDRTKKEVKLDEVSDENRELVAAFARKVDELPQDVIDELKKKVFKSCSGETPFLRRRRGIRVPAHTTLTLWDYADKIRSAFVADDELEFPVMDVLEFRMQRFFPEFCFDVWDADEMDGDEGRVMAGLDGLILRQDVYERAWDRRGRDRFTACHELGHYLMHRHIPMARASAPEDKIYTDSEWQADTFAGALLLPRRHATRFQEPASAAEAFGITEHAAEVMLDKYRRRDAL